MQGIDAHGYLPDRRGLGRPGKGQQEQEGNGFQPFFPSGGE